MFDDSRSFIGRPFLQATLHYEFEDYQTAGKDADVLATLKKWHGRAKLSETQAETAFIQAFFVELWGYSLSGHGKTDDHTIWPKFDVPGAGAKGGAGKADVALGWFLGKSNDVPQVLCEFKDIKSDLDAKQNRKGFNLTPVEQCLNYVKGSRRNLFGNETVQPWWGLVTDMNEFRLYWWDRAPQNYLKFTISTKKDLFTQHDLLSDSKDAQFDRFLFCRLFHRDMLISASGRPPLWRRVEKQWSREEAIEEEFYEHYKGVRERLFRVLVTHNRNFTGTPSDLLRISQKLLDRFIFAFYCEDMGERMLFPPQFIRDELIDRCKKPYYESDGTDIWEFFKRLFAFMNTGGKFGQQPVPQINGGLFADDELLNSLNIPNSVFAAPKQGDNPASLFNDKETLLFLSANYNYAAKGDAKESLTLYTLGRIFEQSITELEYRIGELEQRDTVAKLSKRKRDGVYYTPEWVVNYLVDETMGPWFTKAQEDCGLANTDKPTADQLSVYLKKLRDMRVVDPACGSGAFLISAFRKLLDERKSLARKMGDLAVKDASGVGFEEAALVADILTNNIYGVDINPSSVEIAKLALWLHSARAKSPLSSLDGNIRCGNSLVAHDCWAMIAKTPDNEARVNPFDWDETFPFKFDIVLGNPPYVKLQNLMKVDPDVVSYLRAQRAEGTYESAQTGNFDLYLPFIEKGLRLLASGGRMAYIAPSLWTVNEYGEGLRKLIHRTKQLERWVDFKSYQVFKEAITYTALQIFSKSENEQVGIIGSPGGELGDLDWKDKRASVEVAEFESDSEWLMITGEERRLISRLGRDCNSLGSADVTQAIFQGLVTSADSVYHLKRVGKNSYLCAPDEGSEFEVAIEDSIMKPLISGPQAKRYEAPNEDKFLLFPYLPNESGQRELATKKVLQSQFPLAWSFLRKFEKELRNREHPKMDTDEGWWGYVYPKNLTLHDHRKLIVAQTVPSLRVSADFDANKYLNNVRVNGILAAKGCDLAFLLGALNGNVADFVFRRIGKPKDGGWFEANKQFIAPLPIPHADKKQQAEIGKRARDLHKAWTKRRDVMAEAKDRLSTLARATYKARFLWPDLPDHDMLKRQAPKAMKLTMEINKWVKEKFEELEEARIETLQGFLDAGLPLTTDFSKGELSMTSEGRAVFNKIYLDVKDGKLAEVYWRFLILGQPKDAKSFARDLARIPSGPETPAARQFVQRVDALIDATTKIRAMETAMNGMLYDLYNLSAEERTLIEKDCAKRRLL
jgi:Eco57I restriction-modification methylase